MGNVYDAVEKTLGLEKTLGFGRSSPRPRPIPHDALGWSCPRCGTHVLSLERPRPAEWPGGFWAVLVSLQSVSDPDRNPVPGDFLSIVPADCVEAEALLAARTVLES
jgi:hypothetical protein